MSDFDMKVWRRELEQAIGRGEAIPIRILLDQLEVAFDELEQELVDASYEGEPA